MGSVYRVLRGVIRGTAASHSHPLYSPPQQVVNPLALSLLYTHTQNSELLEAHHGVNLVFRLDESIHTHLMSHYRSCTFHQCLFLV